MIGPRRFAAIALLALTIAACAAPAKRPLIDPFPLSFPLVEAGSFDIDGHVAGQPQAKDGVINYRTREGAVTAVVVSSRAVLWQSKTGRSLPDSPGPVGELVFGRDDVHLQAVDGQGKPIWTFQADGAIPADPVRSGKRVFFGDSKQVFYCLDAATGKVKWRRRLQGAPLHPAIVRGGAVAVAASNSAVYRLSRRGGSILSWEAIPSRVVYELAAAGSLAIISSASPTVTALDLKTGKRVGQYEAPGPLVAGAVWSAPYVVLFMEDEDSGRQKIVFLRSR